MKNTVSKFDQWILNEHREGERLRELNESFDEKDEKRIKDLISKVDKQNLLGSEKLQKEITLATNMANSITDRNKAIRRGDAADSLDADHLAAIFYKRAKELGAKDEDLGITVVDYKEDDEKLDLETEDKPEAAPKKERKKRVPKENRPPRPTKIQKGDYIPVTAEMILENAVGLHERKGGWRWITVSDLGKRVLNIIDPERSRRGRKHGYQRGVDAAAKLDKDYLDDLKGKEPVFYVRASKIGGQWIEGDPMFFNGLIAPRIPNKVRFKKQYLKPAGTELKIITDDLAFFNANYGKTKFFIGDEDFLLDKTGKSLSEITPGQYVLSALNFELTNKSNKLVVWCYPTRETSEQLKSNKIFFVPLDKAIELKDAISPEQMKVVGEYMGKQLGGVEIQVDGPEFRIPWFSVQIGKGKGLAEYNASPFFTRAQAEKHVEELKEKAKTEKLPFDVNGKVDISTETYAYRMYRLDFSQLMDYAKIAGIDVKMREFFEAKKGAIAAKKFGFN